MNRDEYLHGSVGYTAYDRKTGEIVRSGTMAPCFLDEAEKKNTGHVYIRGVVHDPRFVKINPKTGRPNKRKPDLPPKPSLSVARSQAYPRHGDALDAIMKGFAAMRDKKPLPKETLDWVKACEKVKKTYPKR